MTKIEEPTKEDLNIIQEYIRENSGIEIQEESRKVLAYSLKERLKKSGINSFSEYLKHLKFDPQGFKEFAELLNLLTIRETYFFRTYPHFKVLKEKILPEIVQRKLKYLNFPKIKPTLRIWSAGCSTGEEPYSIAIIIRETIPHITTWNLEILATDISTDALTTAQNAIYGERGIKYVESELLDKYFSYQDNKYYLKDNIKKMVKFTYHNLVSDEYPQNLDIIFCRNVTIYFRKETTRKIISNFYKSLVEDGYLIIGHAESLYGMGLPFELVDLGDAFVYRKKIEIDKKKEKRYIPPPEKKEIAPGIEIKATLPFSPATAKDTVKESKLRDVEKLYAKAQREYENINYDQAIKFAKEVLEKEKHHLQSLFLIAKINADRENYEESINYLKTIIELNPLYSPAHFLLGIIYNKLENKDKAIEQFKKTIYLSPNFSLAHFNLANLYRSLYLVNNALREYENTLNTIKYLDKDTLEEFAGGWTKEMLEHTCRLWMEKLKK